MTSRRLLRGLVLAALGSVLVYGVLAALTDAPAVASALRGFPLPTLGAMIALTLVCYFLRALRWRFLVSRVDCPMSLSDAVYVQFSGMTMTVTPGKVGEVLKAYLAREICDLRMSRGIAIVFSERLADLIAVLVLSLGGVSLLGGAWFSVALAGLVIALGTFAVSSERFHQFVLRLVMSRKWSRRHHASATAMSETVREVLRTGPFVVSIAFSLVAWGAEGVAFALSLRALGFTALGIWPAIAIYAASTVVGALAFLPGGIGFTELSIAALLVAAGMPGPDASAATVIIRLVTMWFGVGLGWIVFATRPRMLRAFFSAPAIE
ncbi:MAG: flippase-like domain-containing protein [Coriobacteriia bacterium]|nr:flippase-like domain-containing protein [Coriobacteriia bacterium]